MSHPVECEGDRVVFTPDLMQTDVLYPFVIDHEPMAAVKRADCAIYFYATRYYRAESAEAT